MKIKQKLTTFPDAIPVFILKDACILTLSFCMLLNICLKTSMIPEIWKLSKLYPFYENGEKSDIKNLGPISIISNFCIVSRFVYLVIDVNCWMSKINKYI